MTKKIRIENADTSNWKVSVEVWQVGSAVEGGDNKPDTKLRTVEINNTCQLAEEYIHSGQYLIVREAVPSEK
jgi:hypothetical protein